MGAVFGLQLPENVSDVGLDRLWGDDEGLGHFLMGIAASN